MERMLCESCGAALPSAPGMPCLTCEYCGTVTANPGYDASLAVPAAPDMDAQCVALLKETGASAGLPGDVFGAPLTGAYAAREALTIPGEEQVYFVLAHATIWKTFSEGFALCDTGLYYLDGGDRGKRSWEGFATGEISGTPYGGWGQEGSLRIGKTVFPLNSDADNDAAEFLVDFHHRCYRLFTGSTAPAAWTLSSGIKQTAAAAGQSVAAAAVANTVFSAARSLLGAAVRRQISRTTLQHPAARQGARRPAPPRPFLPFSGQRGVRPARPHQMRSGHPAGPGRPGGMGRPGMRGPGGPGRGRR